jgi:phage shock protein C
MISHMTESNGSEGKRLLRLRKDRMVAGVCVGLADYFKVDVNLVRLGFGVFTVVSFGLGILIYLTAWVILPEEDEDNSILESFIRRL